MLKKILVTLLAALGLSPSVQAAKRPPESKFLWISDLHFNPMADPMLVDQLRAAEPDEWESILNRTQPPSYSLYGSDTNWWLLKSAMQQFPATLRHPAFIMVTGDLLAHSFPQTYRAITHDENQKNYRLFVQKTVKFLASQIQNRFHGTKIFMTPGNNDNDCGNYSIESNGAFLADTAPTVRDLAAGDDQFVSDWKKLGSYNVPHPTIPNVRIISFNSVFFSQKYQALSSNQNCAKVDSKAGAALFEWLNENIEAAKRAKQHVWLMFHIPPGIDGYSTAAAYDHWFVDPDPEVKDPCKEAITPMWKLVTEEEKTKKPTVELVDWTRKFDDLIAQESSPVQASFAAHIHSDDFRLIGAGAGQQFVLLNVAISPVYSQNPGFRVVTYKDDGTITDQTTYYLANLTGASSTKKGIWKPEYTFTKAWKTPTLNAASLNEIYNRVLKDKQAREQWLKMYAVAGPTEQQEKRFVQALYCADEALSVEDYQKCFCAAPPK